MFLIVILRLLANQRPTLFYGDRVIPVSTAIPYFGPKCMGLYKSRKILGFKPMNPISLYSDVSKFQNITIDSIQLVSLQLPINRVGSNLGRSVCNTFRKCAKN